MAVCAGSKEVTCCWVQVVEPKWFVGRAAPTGARQVVVGLATLTLDSCPDVLDGSEGDMRAFSTVDDESAMQNASPDQFIDLVSGGRIGCYTSYSAHASKVQICFAVDDTPLVVGKRLGCGTLPSERLQCRK